jgi:hypothetical protein
MGFFGKLLGKKDAPPRADPAMDQLRRLVQHRAAQASRERDTRLDGPDELVAQRIQKLLYSVSYSDQSGRTRPFEAACKELQNIGQGFSAPGGPERWRRIRGRVQVLCGENFEGLERYLYYAEPPPPAPVQEPAAAQPAPPAVQPAPVAARPAPAVWEFLAPLSIQERVAVSNRHPDTYEAVIAAKKSSAGAQVQVVDLNRSGGSVGTAGGPAALLWKLDVADLERLAQSVRCTMRADDEPEIEWATELYKKAFDLNPYDDLAVMSYGVGLARQGKLREGEKWIKKATELNPANLRAQQNLAALRSQL